MSGINPPPKVNVFIAAEDPIDVIPLTIPAINSPDPFVTSPSLKSFKPSVIDPTSPISASSS